MKSNGVNKKYSNTSALVQMLNKDALWGYTASKPQNGQLNGNCIVAGSELECDGDEEFKASMKKQMMAADFVAQKEEAEVAVRGFCPHCHMLRTVRYIQVGRRKKVPVQGPCSNGCVIED